MNKEQAKSLIREVFEKPFDEKRYVYFIKNLVNQYEPSEFSKTGAYIKQAFIKRISVFKRLGKYFSTDGKRIDILIVYLKDKKALEARTFLRNFVAEYLKGKHGTDSWKDAALVAFVPPDREDWRFSLVKVDYHVENGKIVEEKSPARRWSFLVGKNENSHTAQSQLVKILEDDRHNPTLEELEEAFSVEPVTKEFFEKYRELFIRTVDELDKILKRDNRVREEFTNKGINTVDFAKKLLGQIVFLYFLQKKGWLGVPKNGKWGEGDRNFLRSLFERCKREGKNFFNDYLEYLFYDALNNNRRGTADPSYHPKFNCKIPFLNGGLFEPVRNYDWKNIDIDLPNELFSNRRRTKEGDIGDGILDVFDRFNFTVKEDEPLEKEVAVDPELLGKLYEKFNAITHENFYEYKKALASGRKNEEKNFNKEYGVFYTPREIVHYMCQQSLIYYLAEELKGKVPKEDIEKLILHGEEFLENEEIISNKNKGKETKTYRYKLPESVRIHAKEIDEKLKDVKVVDPAVGSGAFLVGMMTEIVKAREVLSAYINEENRTPYHFKLQCIENSLYGVDIDQGATEIAKLRLWLSLVVDEESLEKIQPLPNLDYKIVKGNSLIGIKKDVFNNALILEIERLKKLLFKETSHEKKLEYKKQIEKLLDEVTDGRKKFDFKLYFSEVFNRKGGFDVVISNPPYIDSETMVGTGAKTFRKYITKHYKLAKGNWDIYIPFFERGINLLNNGGILSFITPDKWLSKPFGYNLRKYMVKNIVMLAKAGREVFENVNVDAIITFITRKSNYELKFVKFRMGSWVTLKKMHNSIIKEPYLFDFYFSKHIGLLLKIENNNLKLQNIGTCENACATSDAYKLKPLIFNLENGVFDDQKYFKVINTGTIGKYIHKWGVREMVYLGPRYLFPVVEKKAFFNIFKNRKYSQIAVKPKIIIKGLTLLDACLDMEGNLIPGKSTLVVTSKDILALKLLLAVINSKLIVFYIRQKYASASYNQGIVFTKNMINSIPLPEITEKHKDKIINLVDKILFYTRQVDYFNNIEKQTKVRDYQQQIDQLVYELYGLTEDEIKIVEGGN